ncbi:MAG: hypothetical protein JSU65_12290 [Candidatus Zixiibacteriota bacterium]|nr:MAG: hypothetical protein JSU65_12290 [candidate division Zixibacteria bacterium]
MEPAQKKGMSKGCMISLIIVSVLVLIVIILGITCWVYKEDLAKMAGITAVESVKTMVAENPPEGIDTTQFNAVTDAFIGKINADSLSMERYAEFMQAVQPMMSDQEISAEEAEWWMSTIVEYFPDLAGLYQPVEVPDTTVPADSAISE